MTKRERKLMRLMANQVRAKDTGDIERYQELQSEIETLARRMGWPLHLVRDGPVGVVEG